MGSYSLLAAAVRVAVLLGAALAVAALLRRSPAATRRYVLALALFGALAIPVVSALAPAFTVTAPVPAPALRAIFVPEQPIVADDPARANPATGAPAGPSTAARDARFNAGDLLEAVWALGALAGIARLVVSARRARALGRRASAAPEWSAAVERVEAVLGVRAQVRSTGEVDAPVVTGVFAPVVLVPPEANDWGDERRHAVLLHELAHVRQRDCLVQIVAHVACALHWFNPLAWAVARRLRAESELAADDAVLAGGVLPSRYAADLLSIAASVHGLDDAPAGAVCMARRSNLRERVEAIVAADRRRRPLARARAALLVASAAGVVLAVACTTPACSSAQPAARVAATLAAPDAAACAPTIDPRLQSIAEEELDRALTDAHGVAGAILVLEPSTGEVRANAGRWRGASEDVAVRRTYMTGSTMKPLTLAAALEEGVVSPKESFDCENGAWQYDGQTMKDANPHGVLTVPQMLAVSSNIGFAKVYDRIGSRRLESWLHAFHLGVAPAVDGASAGSIPTCASDKSFRGAVMAIGEGATASPLQMAAAYDVFANGGVYVPPTLSRPQGEVRRDRVLRPETAAAVVAMLEGVVSSDGGTGERARVAGVRVAGKTGTAGWELPDGREGIYASFIGFLPAGAPRWVILVGIEQEGDSEGAPTVAAPVFARVASRALAL
jgi:beta-lactamase regulating signal transducer with metallopeptidase domain